ncbi:hypothetical protein D9619_013363 [Psilocybe cf. subviscida]|uniref:Uncharacterized protein n=1 Tax=Psilocybe cf. subviscida TaxID=2480587 RepID=A0A8H5BRV0_9AGAR|nr:hypothetical protein D9619_013363 [Psilocybe cf. subviscida]
MPDNHVPPHNQIVAVTFTSALFIGIYFSTFIQSLGGLLFTHSAWELRQARLIQWPILVASLSVFALLVIGHGIQLKYWMDEVLTAPAALHVISWIDVALCTNSNLIALITDAVLIFRLWKVYNNSYRIVVLPLVLWVGGLVLSALQIYLQEVRVTRFRVWLPVNVDMGPGIILTPFWASTIILNIYATSMIIYRLLRFKQESVFGGATRTIDFATSLIIESGSLYLIPAISHFVVWWTPNNFAINVLGNINAPILGIVFNLIIIKIAKHRAQEEGTSMRVTEIQFQHENTVKTEDNGDTQSSEQNV